MTREIDRLDLTVSLVPDDADGRDGSPMAGMLLALYADLFRLREVEEIRIFHRGFAWPAPFSPLVLLGGVISGFFGVRGSVSGVCASNKGTSGAGSDSSLWLKTAGAALPKLLGFFKAWVDRPQASPVEITIERDGRRAQIRFDPRTASSTEIGKLVQQVNRSLDA